MRQAELLMAIIMGTLSVYLMWKSSELEIGWIPEQGPGGGAWPFWLAAIMLLCCGLIVYRWFARATPESRSEEPFMDAHAFKGFAVTAGSLAVMLGLIHVIGTYFAIALFLIFFVRFVGRHGWPLTLTLAIASPVGLFFFFEGLLKIILPKGFSEPLFYPLYRLIY